MFFRVGDMLRDVMCKIQSDTLGFCGVKILSSQKCSFWSDQHEDLKLVVKDEWKMMEKGYPEMQMSGQGLRMSNRMGGGGMGPPDAQDGFVECKPAIVRKCGTGHFVKDCVHVTP